MLPRTFLAPEIPDYECNKCPNKLDSGSVDQMLERVGQELAGMPKNPNTCRSFLKRHSGELHENHFYLADVRLALAQLLGQQDGLPALDDDSLNEKIVLCRMMDGLLQTIVPGMFVLIYSYRSGSECFEKTD